MKRGNGEGTEPRPHAKGGWYSQIQLDGKRRTVYGKTPAEVRRKVRELVRRHEDGQPLTDSRAKVRAWATTWETTALPAAGTKVSTRDAYVAAVRLHVLPSLGERAIGTIRTSDCQGVLLAMKAVKLSASYQRLVHSAMRSLFGAAKAEGLVKVNPMAEVARPAPGRSKAVHLTPEMVHMLMGNLARTPTLLHLVPFIALTGTRRGEALGVRWEDVDEEEGVIHLRMQVTRTKSEGLGLRSLKTEAELEDDDDEGAGRDVELTAPLREVLRERRKVQIRDRMAAPPGTWAEDHGLVFTTKLGGMIEPNNVNRAFRGAAQRAGLRTAGKGKVTPHSLRHSVATLLLAAGVDEKVVAEILGHSSVRTLREVYQHVLREQRTEALGKVGEALGWS